MDALCEIQEVFNDCQKKLQASHPTNFKPDESCLGHFDSNNGLCWPHLEHAGYHEGSVCQHINTTESVNLTASCVFGYYVKGEEADQCKEFITFTQYDENIINVQDHMMTTIQYVYSAFYVISLILLIIAITILLSVRSLRCTRNFIHVNLMISFVLRYAFILIKDQVVFTDTILPNMTEVVFNADGNYALMDLPHCSQEENMWCRVMTSVSHYAVITNFFWLLAEGIYLQYILSRAFIRFKYFPLLMVLGWVAPMIPTIVWAVLRYTEDNVGCWIKIGENKESINWAIEGPVIASIMVNIGVFTNVVLIIRKKLQAHYLSKTDYKYKLARSTLSLIPLLGTHYILKLAFAESFLNKELPVAKILMMIFTAVQGGLCAILYCFQTDDVSSELKRIRNKWSNDRTLPTVEYKTGTSIVETELNGV